jgi:hypothetical protein
MVRLAQALVEGTTALSALVAVQRRARWGRARLLDIQSDLLDLHAALGRESRATDAWEPTLTLCMEAAPCCRSMCAATDM